MEFKELEKNTFLMSLNKLFHRFGIQLVYSEYPGTNYMFGNRYYVWPAVKEYELHVLMEYAFPREAREGCLFYNYESGDFNIFYDNGKFYGVDKSYYIEPEIKRVNPVEIPTVPYLKKLRRLYHMYGIREVYSYYLGDTYASDNVFFPTTHISTRYIEDLTKYASSEYLDRHGVYSNIYSGNFDDLYLFYRNGKFHGNIKPLDMNEYLEELKWWYRRYDINRVYSTRPGTDTVNSAVYVPENPISTEATYKLNAVSEKGYYLEQPYLKVKDLCLFYHAGVFYGELQERQVSYADGVLKDFTEYERGKWPADNFDAVQKYAYMRFKRGIK